MADSFATISDVTELWRNLTADEQTRASKLLPLISNILRDEAHKVGKDLDRMLADGDILSDTVKAVTVDVLSRVLRQSTEGEPMNQESQAALGYSWSGTLAIPGGGIANAVMRNDLKRLGLRRQKIGGVPLC